MNNTPQKPNNLNKWGLASIALELGYIIALPLLGFSLAGKWLDQKFGTDPWFTLAGVILAITATTVWITKKVKTMINK